MNDVALTFVAVARQAFSVTPTALPSRCSALSVPCIALALPLVLPCPTLSRVTAREGKLVSLGLLR
jgi:hypothetical protein